MPKVPFFAEKQKQNMSFYSAKLLSLFQLKKKIIIIVHHVLSYNIIVIQWIMLSHKNLMITRVIMQICNVIDSVRVSNAFSYSNNVHSEGDIIPL